MYEHAERNYLLHPAKPFVDGEPAYEDTAVRFWEYLDWNTTTKAPAAVLDADGLVKDQGHFKAGFITAYDVRVTPTGILSPGPAAIHTATTRCGRCTRRIADPQVVAWWYDPQEGKTIPAGEMPNTGIHQFTPPGSGTGNDWLLLLDSKKAKYKAPE